MPITFEALLGNGSTGSVLGPIGIKVMKSLGIFALAAAAVVLGASAEASAATLVTNGDFESPNIGTSNYIYPEGSFAGWTWSGNAGIINAQGSSAWYGGTSPSGFSGDQYAFVQTGGSFSQTFTVASAETGTVSWLSGSRPNFGPYDGTASYEVLLNDTVIDTISTGSDQNFIAESVAGVSLVAGANTLEFLNIDNSGDHTAFVDNVAVSAVPLPAAAPLFAAAMAALGGLGLRRRRKAA
jgi:hypothetical protein